MYDDDSRTHAKCKARIESSFSVKLGLHRWLALSSFLLATIMDCTTNEVQREVPWDMLFFHDVVFCGETSEEVEGRLEVWRCALKDR